MNMIVKILLWIFGILILFLLANVFMVSFAPFFTNGRSFAGPGYFKEGWIMWPLWAPFFILIILAVIIKSE